VTDLTIGPTHALIYLAYARVSNGLITGDILEERHAVFISSGIDLAIRKGGEG